MPYHHAAPRHRDDCHIILVGSDAAGHHLVVEDGGTPRPFPDRPAAIAFAQRESRALGHALVLVTPYQLRDEPDTGHKPG